MEFTVKKDDLERHLQFMQGVVETKITMPILANILLNAEGETLTLKATDLEVWIESAIPSVVKTSGASTVSIRKLYEYAKGMPAGDIAFARGSDSGISMISGDIVIDLVEIPAVEFPRLPDFPAVGQVKLSAEIFCDMLRRIAFNLTTDEQKQHRGSLFVMTPDSLVLVATDGHRMTYIKKGDVTFDLPTDVPEYRLILNRKAIQTILKMEPIGDIVMDVGENHAFFRVGTTAIASRLLELKFPRYEKVMPRDNDKILRVQVAPFLASLKLACLATNEKAKPVKILFRKDGIRLTATGIETRQLREFVPGHYNADEIELKFNGQYLIDFLQVVGTEEVQVEVKDADKAVLIRPIGKLPCDYLYVLMPMTL